MKSGLRSEMTSLERDSLVGFYYFSAFVICPDKKMVFGVSDFIR